MSQIYKTNTGSGPPGSVVVTTSAEGGTAFPPDGAGNVDFSGQIATDPTGTQTVTFNQSVNGKMHADAVFPHWQVITTNQAATKSQGYFTQAASGPAGLTVTLPAICAVGDSVYVYDQNGNGWVVAVSAGQSIQVGINSSTTTTGTVTTNNVVGNSIVLVCAVANTKWEAIQWNGNFLIT